jgi:probable phosphomutase (TIGR03848 family)
MTIHLLLVRHARSSANTEGILAGRLPGIELDEQGKKDAIGLISRLNEVPVSKVIGSPLQRCIDTLKPVCDERSLEYQVDSRLNECDYGVWSGRPLIDLVKEPLWQTIQKIPSQVTFPEGEAMVHMQKRAVDSVTELVASAVDGEVVVVVSHGDVIKSIVAHALNMSLDDFQRIIIDPASMTLLRFADEKFMVVRVNDSATPLAALLSGSTQAVLGGGAGAGGASQAKGT